MRKNSANQTLTAKHYQNFAWFTLGLAVVAGLSGEGFGSKAATATTQPLAKSAAIKPARLTSRSDPWARGADDGTGELADETAAAAPAPDIAALTGPSQKAGAKPVRTAVGPTPGQIDRLVAASRERSGSAEQGDEPRLAS